MPGWRRAPASSGCWPRTASGLPETIAYWEGTDEIIAAYLGMDASEFLVARTYQIVVGGRPSA